MPKALHGYSGGRLPGRSTEEKGREEEEEEEECANSKQGQENNETIEEGIRSSQRMAFKRQNPIQRWDSSQTENEEEEKEEESWQEGEKDDGKRSNIWMT